MAYSLAIGLARPRDALPLYIYLLSLDIFEKRDLVLVGIVIVPSSDLLAKWETLARHQGNTRDGISFLRHSCKASLYM